MYCHDGRFNVIRRTGKELSEASSSFSNVICYEGSKLTKNVVNHAFFFKVCEFTKSGELDNNVIQILWERFAMKIPNTNTSESRGAVILLSMAAG